MLLHICCALHTQCKGFEVAHRQPLSCSALNSTIETHSGSRLLAALIPQLLSQLLYMSSALIPPPLIQLEVFCPLYVVLAIPKLILGRRILPAHRRGGLQTDSDGHTIRLPLTHMHSVVMMQR